MNRNIWLNITTLPKRNGTSGKKICVKFQTGEIPYSLAVSGENHTPINIILTANTGYKIEAEYDGGLGKFVMSYISYSLS